LKYAENQMLNIFRHCKGDVSETGLVQFAQSIMDLDAARAKMPTHKYTSTAGKETECLIPFSSDIKFNAFIRDTSADGGNLQVFLKGAPERVLNRCSKILLNGEEVDFTDDLRNEVNEANKSFGALGERVLAFAKCDLPADRYPRDSYQFDMKAWKEWGLAVPQTRADYENVDGSFPLHDLTLVGVVSLNDPPRLNVDMSVNKCRSAGIKVIMVTGDQPPTAAAIATKVNILKHPTKEFNYMKNELGMDKDKAWAECTGVVVHGDLLALKHKEQENMADDDPEKGKFLTDWINKHEVVFARTTPSQKLLIVDAAQKAGHVVAVTGDGVNDSPAIKKADIGIAMGSGSDVAKNAADMLLLDDNFSSIVNGVEEGRLIFDNLKKSIAYTLSSNIPEILPFIFFILFQVPLPLSTVLILCIDLGTDMIPAISFAYENPELDIMDRAPRNSKKDHLVNAKLISFAYFQIGVIQASAGMYTYFLILNDFGLRPSTVWFLSQEVGPIPNPNDQYKSTGSTTLPAGSFQNCPCVLDEVTKKCMMNTDPIETFGNTNFLAAQFSIQGDPTATGTPQEFDRCDYANSGEYMDNGLTKLRNTNWFVLGWDKYKNGKVDIRMFYAQHRDETAWTTCRWDPSSTEDPSFFKFSNSNDYWPICYSTEALKYAQSGYLVSIVAVQWADLMICKTRNLSLSQQGMNNSFGNFGLFSETALVAILLYVPFMNYGLQTRQIPFPHFAVPSFSFYVAIFFYDEMRKITLRKGMTRKDGKLVLSGWVVQNTYY